MENHHVQWKNPLFQAIFHSYVNLPEGNQNAIPDLQLPPPARRSACIFVELAGGWLGMTKDPVFSL